MMGEVPFSPEGEPGNIHKPEIEPHPQKAETEGPYDDWAGKAPGDEIDLSAYDFGAIADTHEERDSGSEATRPESNDTENGESK